MERRSDLIERDDQILSIIIGSVRGGLEHFGRFEIRTAIECRDRVVDRCRWGIVIHDCSRLTGIWTLKREKLQLLFFLDRAILGLAQRLRLAGAVTLVELEQARLVRPHFAERTLLILVE